MSVLFFQVARRHPSESMIKLLVVIAQNHSSRVLITGATGYLAMHCIQQLLQQGYKVRGTVRDFNCSEKIHPLRQLANNDQLELFCAALEDGADLWEKAAAGCTYVLHVASPCEMIADKAIVKTAVRGTLNVLRGASQQRCVRKVVLTSSLGHKKRAKPFTENDWTNLNWKHLHPYHRSKTLAERVAWSFMEKNPDVCFSLTVLNPTLIVGPLLQNTKGASVTIISRFLDGSMPAYPQMKFGLVDVRDVARAHILAMKETKSDGQRILINAETLSFRQIAKILREEFAKQGYSVPRFKIPYLVLWLCARVDNEALQALPFYGHEDNFDNSKANFLLFFLEKFCVYTSNTIVPVRLLISFCVNEFQGFQLLGMSYHDVRKSLIEMAYDMIERNILPKSKKYVEEKKTLI
ncbi:NAD dependent epimerase/dehydratase family protein [Onchocerca flexuosa]|uniref:NAD dependent epimerase/dehydratase family protein n=1 Tax=Onchocerca flexuosa TaxID=387005 RepID=A0A238BNI2_9BILA|nr:NAD dependent epimerase/dehydratase family protein [Onchocerca flexuosa]